MHVLHLDSELSWRGGQNQLYLLIAGLQARGIRNTCAAPAAGALAKRLQGVCPVLALLPGQLGPLIQAYFLARYCRRHGVAILDAHSSHAHLLGLLIKCYASELKLVVHRRVDFPLKKTSRHRWKYLNHRVDGYVAISATIGRLLAEYGVTASRLACVPSAVDPGPHQRVDRGQARQALRQRLNLPADTLLIGQAAAMTQQKGYEVLLAALALLKQQGYAFHAVIAGDGPLWNELQQLQSHLGLKEHLSFLGWQADIPQFLAGLDIFAMPSRFEGLGTAALEALYAGCCVVASDAGGLTESILHGQTGLVAPVGDAKAFAAQLAKALQEPALRQELNTRGQAHVQTAFSLESMVTGNLAVYQRLLGS